MNLTQAGTLTCAMILHVLFSNSLIIHQVKNKGNHDHDGCLDIRS